MKNTPRFIPQWRQAIDGKVWACVYDTTKMEFSNLLCFGKYKTKKACQYAIDYYTKTWKLTEA